MRKIERHPSNQGSVITFDMYGKEVNLFVADAKYRCIRRMVTHKSNFCLFAIERTALINLIDPDGVKTINPNNTDDKPRKLLSYNLDDTQLQTRFPSFKSDKSAKENTDILMRYEGTDAAHHCRNQNIENIGQLDLPNIYELMVLYLESDRIDALDPTLNENTNYALGKLCIRFNFNMVYAGWSSTLCDRKVAHGVSRTGYVCRRYMSEYGGVVPVKEL